MSRAPMAATLLVGLLLTAGCSGSKPISAAGPAKASAGTTTGSEPAAVKNPLTGLSAQEIWAESQKDLTEAKSVHMAVKALDDGEWTSLNLKTSPKKAFGTIRIGKTTIVVRRIGKVLYFKGNKAFWSDGGDKATAAKVAGHWIKTTKGDSKEMDGIFELTELPYLLKEFLDVEESDVKNLEIIPGRSIGGQNTVGVSDAPAGKPTAESAAIFIAADELAFPMNIDLGAGGKQYMKFRNWNKPVNVVVPKGFVGFDDLADLL
jgi:hypothetical protein